MVDVNDIIYEFMVDGRYDMVNGKCKCDIVNIDNDMVIVFVI